MKLLAIDTEFTAEKIPYYVSTCDDDGKIVSWEFNVSPQRKVTIPQSFQVEFGRRLKGRKPIFHNAKADVPVLRNAGWNLLPLDGLGVYSHLSTEQFQVSRQKAYKLPFHDTLIASHLWRSDGSHGLKDLAYELLDFPTRDEKELIEIIKTCRGLIQRYPEAFKYRLFKADHECDSGDGQSWLKWDSWIPSTLARLHAPALKNHGVDFTEIQSWESSLANYGNADSERTMGLWLFIEKWFDEHSIQDDEDDPNGVAYWARYWEAMQVLPAVMSMEERGVTLNWENLQVEKAKYQRIFDDGRAKSLAAVRDIARPNVFGKGPFNPNSDQQLRKLLHEHWGLPVMGHTKGGQPSVKAEVLEALVKVLTDAPAAIKALLPQDRDKILTFLGGMQKSNSASTALSYLKAYADFAIHSDPPADSPVRYANCLSCEGTGEVDSGGSRPDGKFINVCCPECDGDGQVQVEISTVYPSYNTTGTRTTRFSSSAPNITNVGKGEEEEEVQDDGTLKVVGKEFQLRKCFGPAPGRIWVAIDYQQLQLINFAYMANDPYLKAVFESGKDIHDEVAREMFDTDEPTKLQRRAAKAVNFGIIFGAGDKKTDLSSGMPGTSSLFKSKLPGVQEYMQKVMNFVRRHGRVLTLGGYPLQVDRKFAYAGVCYIDQGTEGQLVKRAMTATHRHLEGTPDFLRFMVHDELVFDFAVRPPVRQMRLGKRAARPDDAFLPYKQDVIRLKSIMQEAALSIGVPAKCSVSIHTNNWADSVELAW